MVAIKLFQIPVCELGAEEEQQRRKCSEEDNSFWSYDILEECFCALFDRTEQKSYAKIHGVKDSITTPVELQVAAEIVY